MTFKDRVMHRLALDEGGYRNLVRSSALCTVNNLAMMLPAITLLLFVCDILGDNPYDFDIPAWGYAAMVVACIAVMCAVSYLQLGSTSIDVYNQSSAKRISMAERIRMLPMSFFGRTDPTDLSVRFMGDVAVQETAMMHWFPQMVGAIASTVVVGVVILLYNPMMGAASLWPVPVSYTVIFLSKRILQDRVRDRGEHTLEATEGVQEYLETVRDLKGCDYEDEYLRGLFEKIDATERYETRSEFTAATFVMMSQMVLKFGLATTALAGAYLLLSGQLDLIVFVLFLVLVSRLYDPLSSILTDLASMFNTEYNMARIQEIEDEPIQTGTTEFHPDGYGIEFNHVGFSYDKGHEVLRDVSFKACQGEVTALIGPSGEGKSTAAKLAARFWDVDRGSITVGGVDVSTVDPETLLSCFSIVFQDVVLFNTTVMENIRIGKKGATDEEVMAAARAARCDEFVSELPEGYGTVIGENGAKLSGGERQRVSIARAILKDAPIVILDEATASLDTESETRVQQALSELVRGKTVLIVAHRMRTVEGADKIVVLTDGVVKEQGSPAELMSEGGSFADMVRLQSSSDAWSIRPARAAVAPMGWVAIGSGPGRGP